MLRSAFRPVAPVDVLLGRRSQSAGEQDKRYAVNAGLANVGRAARRPGATGTELRSEGIAVSTVGLGDDYNED